LRGLAVCDAFFLASAVSAFGLPELSGWWRRDVFASCAPLLFGLLHTFRVGSVYVTVAGEGGYDDDERVRAGEAREACRGRGQKRGSHYAASFPGRRGRGRGRRAVRLTADEEVPRTGEAREVRPVRSTFLLPT